LGRHGLPVQQRVILRQVAVFGPQSVIQNVLLAGLGGIAAGLLGFRLVSQSESPVRADSSAKSPDQGRPVS
jgi:hypothetical protein